MSENKVIGKDNKLPWRMPADWKHFHRITKNKPFIMGRKSYEAPDSLLSTRISVILSGQEIKDLCDKCHQAESIRAALDYLKKEPEIFILGGQNVFEQFLPTADYIYLTIIHTDINGDSYFPELDENNWEIRKNEFHKKDAENPYDYTFRELKRKDTF